MRIKTTRYQMTINDRRDPIFRKVKTECCPTCKQPLSFIEAVNDTSDCKCGEWWYQAPSPYSTTSPDIDAGWHFKAESPQEEK